MFDNDTSQFVLVINHRYNNVLNKFLIHQPDYHPRNKIRYCLLYFFTSRKLLNVHETKKLKTVLESDPAREKYAFKRNDGEGKEATYFCWMQTGNDATGMVARSEKVAGTFEKVRVCNSVLHSLSPSLSKVSWGSKSGGNISGNCLQFIYLYHLSLQRYRCIVCFLFSSLVENFTTTIRSLWWNKHIQEVRMRGTRIMGKFTFSMYLFIYLLGHFYPGKFRNTLPVSSTVLPSSLQFFKWSYENWPTSILVYLGSLHKDVQTTVEILPG